MPAMAFRLRDFVALIIDSSGIYVLGEHIDLAPVDARVVSRQVRVPCQNLVRIESIADTSDRKMNRTR